MHIDGMAKDGRGESVDNKFSKQIKPTTKGDNMSENTTKYYTVLCFGSPDTRWTWGVNKSGIYKNERRAINVADQFKNTGSCSDACVVEFDNMKAAKSADISDYPKYGGVCTYSA